MHSESINGSMRTAYWEALAHHLNSVHLLVAWCVLELVLESGSVAVAFERFITLSSISEWYTLFTMVNV